MPSPSRAPLGVDALRYYLLRDVPFGQDGNFSHDALLTRYNSDLANGLGNLASRTLTMIERYCGGEVPAPHAPHAVGEAENCARRCRYAKPRATVLAAIRGAILLARPRNHLGRHRRRSTATSRRRSPGRWPKIPSQRASPRDRAVPCRRSRCAFMVALAHPVLAECHGKDLAAARAVWRAGEVRIDQLAWGGLRPGTRIGEPAAVFPRVEKTETLEKIAAMEQEITQSATARPQRRPRSGRNAGRGTPRRGAARLRAGGAARHCRASASTISPRWRCASAR